MILYAEPRSVAQHPLLPLASFVGMAPTCPEEIREISHSLSPLLFPTEHRPLTCLDPVGAAGDYCFKSFSCNTYASPRKCSKQKTYGLTKPFGCNTYKKPGEGSQFWLTRNPIRSAVLSNHRERRSMCPRPCGATNHQSRVSPSSVAAFPAGCYDLVFHVPC
jgi:hypothetical protein